MEIGKFDTPNIALLGSDCGYLSRQSKENLESWAMDGTCKR